MAAAYIQNKL